MEEEPEAEESQQADDPEIYRKANRFMQIGIALGSLILLLASVGVMNFDYGFYAGVICVVVGAGIRQIIVSRH